MRNQVQLYYSSFNTVANLKLTQPGYVQENMVSEIIERLFELWVLSLLLLNLFQSVCHWPTSVSVLLPIDHLSRCVEDRVAQSQRQLFHIKAVTLRDVEEEEKKKEQSRTKEEGTCLNGQEEEELSLDQHVLIHYHRGPVLIGQPIRVSVNLRTNFSAEFVVIR